MHILFYPNAFELLSLGAVEDALILNLFLLSGGTLYELLKLFGERILGNRHLIPPTLTDALSQSFLLLFAVLILVEVCIVECGYGISLKLLNQHRLDLLLFEEPFLACLATIRILDGGRLAEQFTLIKGHMTHNRCLVLHVFAATEEARVLNAESS